VPKIEQFLLVLRPANIDAKIAEDKMITPIIPASPFLQMISHAPIRS
jgi:hypothetical protein